MFYAGCGIVGGHNEPAGGGRVDRVQLCLLSQPGGACQESNL